MKKILSVLLIALLATSMVFAGGNKEKAAAADDGKVTLNIYWWGNQIRNDVTQKAIDLYMSEHPDIVIKAEFADWSGYWDRLSATAAGGNMPDIVQMDYSYLNQYQQNGLLADLNPFFEDGTIDTTNIPESIIASGSIDGHCYALSLGSNAPMMVYDPAVVEEAGVTIPDQLTIEELYEIGNTIYEKTGVSTYYDGGINMMQIVARTYGSHLFDELAAGDDTAMLKHWNYVKWFADAPSAISPDLLSEKNPDIVETKPIADGTTWNDFSFSNQFIAIVNAAGRPLVITMYPTTEDATNQPMYLKPSHFFSIAETSKHKKEAAEFIDWFTNSVEANEILMGERGIPVNTEVAAAIKPLVDENTQAIFDYIDAVGAIATPIDAPDPAGKGEIEAIGKTTAEELRYGYLTVEEATEDYVSRSNSILSV